MARRVQGIAHTWQVSDNPIGSGDAGEVFAVARLDQPELTGVMKKPARVATAGTIQRQANQIAQEALALTRLDGLPRGKAHPPRLLDLAPEFTQGTADYFIISENALGEDIATLVAQTRQTGKPFPRRVIMTVLDALFDLFSRAHKVGVLWNDVKLDHIYWHNPTGQVGVIDWGNALFLQNEGQRVLPRWEDYQQMVNTLGSFLQSSAPDLYVDLGWEEFQGQALDSPRVSILARRISYQQQVIALQVMEYQSLIRVVLSTDPSMEGLRKIAGFKQVLERIGATYGQADVLKYCQSLVETSLAGEDRQTTVRSIALIWEIFDDSLDLPWHLLREYCRHTDILTHAAFVALAKHTLHVNWTDALWSASTIASESLEPVWWDRLIPVMRQSALGTATLPPYQTCQSLLNWAQTNQKARLRQNLISILEDWRIKGSNLDDSPFDYALLDLIREQGTDLPSRLRSEIKQSFASGEEAIRELVKVWKNANYEALSMSFHRVLSWDPDRWGILKLAAQVETFETWRKELFEGPGEGTRAHAFLEHTLETRPKIEHLLGEPPWMTALLEMLNEVSQGAPISAYQAEVDLYCPWLSPFSDIHAADSVPENLDEHALHTHLSHFAGHLKNWSDIDAGLAVIREQTPQVYLLCSRLADGFKQILLLNANLESLAAVSAETVPSPLEEACSVLQSLVVWREHLAVKDLKLGIQSLQADRLNGWVLAAYAHQITADWQRSVVPILEAIRSFSIVLDVDEQPTDIHFKLLRGIAHTCEELPRLWSQINESGLHIHLLENLEAGIETARIDFLKWQVMSESSDDPVTRLLYHTHLEDSRHLSNRFMRMAQHIRQAKLGFVTLGEGDQTSIANQRKNIENILDHLGALETEFVPDINNRHFPDFQSAFNQIVEAKSFETRQVLLSALMDSHPFYAWLVKSTLAQDSNYL